MTAETHTATDRLAEIIKSAQTLNHTAPPADISHMRALISSISLAANSLTQVLRAGPHDVPTVHVARFCTAAEGALGNLSKLSLLYGVNPNASTIETEVEKDLTVTVQTLTAFAKRARDEAVQSLRTDIRSGTDVLAAWNLPLEPQEEASTTGLGGGDLASIFIKTKDSTSHQKTTGVGFSLMSRAPRFISKIIQKSNQTREPQAEILKTFSADDAQATLILSINPSAKRSHVGHNYFLHERILPRKKVGYDEVVNLVHPDFTSAGLSVQMEGHGDFTVDLTDEVPRVLTRLWTNLVESFSMDPDAYRRALTFKDNPEFRMSVRESVISALTKMEEQVHAGVPIPEYTITDPVIRTAVHSALLNLKKNIDTTGIARHATKDTFGVHDGIREVMKKNPGLEVWSMNGTMVLLALHSLEQPEGLSRKLHETHEDILKQIADLGKKDGYHHYSKIFRATWSDGLILPSEAKTAVPDLGENVLTFLRLMAVNNNEYSSFFSRPDEFSLVPVDRGDGKIIMKGRDLRHEVEAARMEI